MIETVAMAGTGTLNDITGIGITAAIMMAAIMMAAIIAMDTLGAVLVLRTPTTFLPITGALTEIRLPTIPPRLARSRGWTFCSLATNRDCG